MNGIIGLVKLLRESPLSASQKHYLANIRQSERSLVDTINNVLAYSKIKAGKFELENIEFDVEQLLEDCLQRFTASARQKNIELCAKIHKNTPTRLVGDPKRIRQLLVNLVSNAVEFTETGQVTVSVAAKALGEADKTHLVFTVKDTGIGIPSNLMPFLFEPLQQDDTNTKQRIRGTGLGLAICKRLVELMDGTMAVDSQLGVGSQFQFSVRLHTAKAVSKPKLRSSIDAACVPDLSGLSVLVAEDNDVNSMVIKGLLSRLGIDPLLTRDGREALGAVTVAERPFDLILMDCEMPELDGFEATSAIRQHEREHQLSATPIVALTAHALDEHNDVAFSSGMDYFLRKPMTFSSFITMAEALGLNGVNEIGSRDKPERTEE
jgi:CheY-like chemotaxis protein/anti-sigma regulatory factor (Ser/Thr protein kinase)